MSRKRKKTATTKDQQQPQQAASEPKKEDQGTRPAPPKRDPRGRRGGPEQNVAQQVRAEADRRIRKLQDEIAELHKRDSDEKGLRSKVKELYEALNKAKQEAGNARGSAIALKAQRSRNEERLANEVKQLRKQLKTNKAKYTERAEKLQKQLDKAQAAAAAPAKKDPKAIRKLRNKLASRDERIADLRERCDVITQELNDRTVGFRHFLGHPAISDLYPMIHVTLQAYVPDTVPMMLFRREDTRFPLSMKLPDGRKAFAQGLPEQALGMLIPATWKVSTPPKPVETLVNSDDVLAEEERKLNEASEAFHDHPSHPSSCEAYHDHYDRRCPCEDYVPEPSPEAQGEADAAADLEKLEQITDGYDEGETPSDMAEKVIEQARRDQLVSRTKTEIRGVYDSIRCDYGALDFKPMRVKATKPELIDAVIKIEAAVRALDLAKSAA